MGRLLYPVGWGAGGAGSGHAGELRHDVVRWDAVVQRNGAMGWVDAAAIGRGSLGARERVQGKGRRWRGRARQGRCPTRAGSMIRSEARWGSACVQGALHSARPRRGALRYARDAGERGSPVVDNCNGVGGACGCAGNAQGGYGSGSRNAPSSSMPAASCLAAGFGLYLGSLA